jgi:hypothetical protein
MRKISSVISDTIRECGKVYIYDRDEALLVSVLLANRLCSVNRFFSYPGDLDPS